MGKIQFPNLRALPAGPRWLAYGVLLLCAILVGGVITAYGGMLLVVLMWAVCMGRTGSFRRCYYPSHIDG